MPEHPISNPNVIREANYRHSGGGAKGIREGKIEDREGRKVEIGEASQQDKINKKEQAGDRQKIKRS